MDYIFEILTGSWIKSDCLPYNRVNKLLPPIMFNRLWGRTKLRFTVKGIIFENNLLTLDETRS